MLAPGHSHSTLAPLTQAAKEVDGTLHPLEGNRWHFDFLRRPPRPPRPPRPAPTPLAEASHASSPTHHGLSFLNFWGAFGVSPMIEYTFVL
jgi:hypothetical protein